MKYCLVRHVSVVLIYCVQSDKVSCWTEYEIENEKEDARSLDESETGSTLDESKPKDDLEVKSDSAYGSRGSIQSPNRYRLKG